MKKAIVIAALGLMVLLGGCAAKQSGLNLKGNVTVTYQPAGSAKENAGTNSAVQNDGQNSSGNSVSATPAQALKNPSDSRIGQKATEFTLNDLSGKKISLSHFKGKKVILNFWATWCPPCRAEMPFIQQLAAEANGNYEILAVNIGENQDVVSKFLKDNGYSFHVAIDSTQKVTNMFMIANIPTSFFIDENGVIKNVHVGDLDETETKAFLGIN